MKISDETITYARRSMYQIDRRNFDDICFTVFRCPSCENETMDLTLLPIIDKEKCSQNNLLHTQQATLDKIYDAEFDFLHEKGKCNCRLNSVLELKSVIYCYNSGTVDYHNYIDYPFNKIRKSEINLAEKSSARTFVFFDTETTGLPTNWKSSYKEVENWPRLVQIAWIIADIKGNIIEQNNYLIKPHGFTIPDDAIKVHQISTTKALQQGHELQFVLNKFNESLRNIDCIVAHNINFDLNVVASEMYRFEIDSNILEKNKICTMESTIEFCKLPGNYGYKFPKLSELHEKLFYTNFNEAHDASVDIKATFRCFYELLKNKTIKI